ncbi:MAG: PilZ domain-containing protein [Deltaproteobacteria bacterium]|nr:PilZ domain-containing protein [Deltaproteobacteria bacterium]MBW2722985.1 PilZ domain-containing protein [Deltaproteobacteria bacterium]
MLAVVFTDMESFAREFHENLLKGGIFIKCDETLALLSRVEVGLDLQFCHKSIVLKGEVVHCVPIELASAGAVPGVAVQFDRSISDLRNIFGDLVGAIPEPTEPSSKEPAEPGADRRKAERYPARVVAKVRNTEGEELEGMTRNLSGSGILFSLAGEPLPMGGQVIVTLTNPKSGEVLEIPAEVVRHLEGEAGDVQALGIRFSPDERYQGKTKRFLRRLRDSEHTRRLGGISGEIQELGLVNLLQSFGLSSREGTITVARDNQEGYIAFSEGALVATCVGRVTGIKALARLMRWKTGRFEFHARIDAQIVRDTPVSLEGAILNAMREIDEADRDANLQFEPGATFELAAEVANDFGSDLGKIEGAILDLVRVGANVRKLLDVIPESDANIHGALANLIEQGALVPQLHDS